MCRSSSTRSRYSQIIVKVICKYLFLAKLNIFEITIIKIFITFMGLKLPLVRLQHFTFITLLSVFLSAFPSHKVHLIYLENNSGLQSFPVLLLTYDLCRCFRCDFTAQRVQPCEDTPGLGQTALAGRAGRLVLVSVGLSAYCC